MKGTQALMILRALLRDEDYKTYIYSDELLLDCLSRAQNALISEFRENIQSFETEVIQGADIAMPTRIASIFSLTLNTMPLRYAQSATAFKNPPCLYHKYQNIYAISGYANGKLKLVASFLPLL